tara:strand:- start:8124 stop:8312 length:189 start_codon:yes stop_codon:yes gene_type:complete
MIPIYGRIDTLSNYLSRIYEVGSSVNKNINYLIEKGELGISQDKKKKIKNIILEIKNDIISD